MGIRRVFLLFGAIALLSGCATTYTLVAPGLVPVDSLQLSPSQAWNKAPRMTTPYARKDAEVWTRDGMLLDRIVVIPGVPDGEAMFVSRQQDAAFPTFRASMLPNELEELAESSIVKIFGEGNAAVSTSGLRPQRFGDQRGVMFDLDIAVSDGPNYRGLVGSFIAGEKLYTIMYFGADPFYFDKHREEAEALITGARLATAGSAG